MGRKNKLVLVLVGISDQVKASSRWAVELYEVCLEAGLHDRSWGLQSAHCIVGSFAASEVEEERVYHILKTVHLPLEASVVAFGVLDSVQA